MASDTALVLEPVLFEAPPTGTTTLKTEVKGVEKVKLVEVAVPAEVADMTA
jgi:hypothetical protein